MTSTFSTPGRHPLTSPQREIWFDQVLHADAPMYVIGGYMHIPGRIDLARFERAVQRWVLRHDALRTVLIQDANDDGLPLQGHAEVEGVAVPLHDFSLADDPHRAALAWMQQRMTEPFALYGELLFTCELLKLSEDGFYWFPRYHHLIADGWTTALLSRSLAEIYTALERGDEPDAAAPSYVPFIENDRAYIDSAAFETQRRYWQARHPTQPEPLFAARPCDAPLPGTPSGCLRVEWPRAWYDRLSAFAESLDTTPFHAILAALYVYFVRTAQREELVIGLPVLNRSNAAFKATAGLFVGVSPVRFDFGVELSFRDLLAAIGRELKRSYRHQRFPVSEINRALGASRQLFDLSVSYERQDYETSFGEIKGRAHALLNGHEQTPLTLFVREFHDTEPVHADFVFSRSHFEAGDIEAIQARFAGILQFVLAHPDGAVKAIALLTPAEAQQLEAWNRSAHDFPLDRTYAACFSERVAQHPDRIVAECSGETLTWRELDRRAGVIARRLAAAGAGRDSVVALLAPRGLSLLAMMVGVQKAGAAMLSLVVDHPVERLREMLELARSPVLLADPASRALAELLIAGNDAAPALLIAGAPDPADMGPEPAPGAPDDLAYVIFTSGSTGKPKGVMVEQRGMLNNIFGKVPTLGLGEHDRIAQTASVCFDISVWQFLAAPVVGAAVHILPDEVAHDPARLIEAIESQQITMLEIVPSMMRRLLDTCPPDVALPSLRWVKPTGEALPPLLARDWFARFPHIRLMNLYGPAECAGVVSCQALDSLPDAEQYMHLQAVPIGCPTPNLQLHILDERQQPLPVGVVGEICIAGAGVGRGYLNNPERTRTAFIEHPFEPGERLYRSGDLGRRRADGVIEFLGRRDHQVKIRGQRIELGEIESRLRQIDGVREAAVTTHTDPSGEMRLVAYWVAREDSPLFAEALNEALARRLPHYMLPAHFVRLDTLPLNANGKTDRRALPAPAWQASQREFAAPQTPTEALLAVLWQGVLGDRNIGRNDHFFDLGGHSLSATQLIAKVQQACGVELPLRAVFEAPLLWKLARRIDAAQREPQDRHAASVPSLVAVDRRRPLPLSFAQQRLWFLNQLEPDSLFYNESLAIRLSGSLNVGALERSLNEIVRRHEVLRTRFPKAPDGMPLQVIEPALTIALVVAEAEVPAPFDLTTGPLIRTTLIRLGDGEHILRLTLHHIVGDGWADHVIGHELGALYAAFSQGLPSPLPELPVQYADFAVWQRRCLTGEALQKQLAYWQAQLAGAPALLELPTDRPRPAMQTHRGARFEFVIPGTLLQALHALSSQAGTTLFMTLAAAFSALLARYSGQTDICIGSPIANRTRPELEALVGCFVNTLVLRSRVDGASSFRELLSQVRETTLGAYQHQDVPFEQLVEALKPARSLSHAPLVQVALALQNIPVTSLTTLDGKAPLTLSAARVDNGTAKFDLLLDLTEAGGALEGVFEYSTDLFDRATIERMREHFEALLAAVTANPDARIGEVPLLTAPECEQRLRVNQTRTPLPPGLLHDGLAASAARWPDKPAVVAADRTLSYAELDAAARRLAHHLCAAGAQDHRFVAIVLDKGWQQAVAAFGVLAAGMAYVPIDPQWPPARVRQLIENAGAGIVVTSRRHTLPPLPAGVCIVAIDDEPIEPRPDAPPAVARQQDDPAYVIFTSGSTGVPKGVAISHLGALNTCIDINRRFGITERDVVFGISSLCFDLSVYDLFGVALAGATLVLPPASDTPDPEQWLDLVRRHGVTVWNSVPALVQLLVGAARARGETLPFETVMMSGDWIPVALPDQIRRVAPHARLHSLGGATEASIWSICHPIERVDPRWPSIPYGRPLANQTWHVLNEHGADAPTGVPGWLHIGGIGLALGYWGDDARTAAAFVRHPRSGERLYRTGDLGRYLPDGNLEFLGRLDGQVKIRGHRIELGEIESALLEQPGVREAVVLARDGSELVAYVVAAADDGIDGAALREGLRRTLPEYMVPAHVVPLDRLPLSANGKVDRLRLPAPDRALAANAYAPPRNALEEVLAGIWADVLQVERVGIHDDFFALGGHSLLATRLLAQVGQRLRVDVPLRQIFQTPSVAQVAPMVEALILREIDALEEFAP